MHVVAILMHQKRFDRTLCELRLDPQDVAQDSLVFLTRKVRDGKIRLDSPGPLVLLQVLYTSVYRFICSGIAEAKRRNGEVSATDYYVARDSAGLDGYSKSNDSAHAEFILSSPDEVEDFVIGGIVTVCAAEADAVDRIYKFIVSRFIKSGEFAPHTGMPESLRKRKDVSYELHARILARFIKYLTQHT